MLIGSNRQRRKGKFFSELFEYNTRSAGLCVRYHGCQLPSTRVDGRLYRSGDARLRPPRTYKCISCLHVQSIGELQSPGHQEPTSIKRYIRNSSQYPPHGFGGQMSASSFRRAVHCLLFMDSVNDCLLTKHMMMKCVQVRYIYIYIYLAFVPLLC